VITTSSPRLAFNGRAQDHRLLNELSREEWLTISDSVKNGLSNEIIESAFHEWPEAVFDLHGKEMIEIGKIRRDKLSEVAEEFYELHARSVDVVGTNKHERFEVNRLDSNLTEVVVFKISKKGKIKEEIYRRVMHGAETDEICLYGLGGNDQFIVKGQVEPAITVYAVGGTGDDTFIDSSTVTGWSNKTKFYDSQEYKIYAGTESSVKISDDPRDNDYTGRYEFPRTYPQVLAWYTSDDGFVFLGGVLYKNHAFRREPYAHQHLISGSFATATNAFIFKYGSTYSQTFGYDWHMGLNMEFSSPNNFRNFYGLGNETAQVENVDSIRVFLGYLNFELTFSYYCYIP
jgi:hypothetical protein